eukprot:Phypoly_transcript_06378.p1 GENE.Phypoly_transcript_06378~~Phypoly_transcript_06378.p1  ORF type:complete len:175 (-),score=18.48 Phypoly_transcript_06378:446-970(-)
METILELMVALPQNDSLFTSLETPSLYSALTNDSHLFPILLKNFKCNYLPKHFRHTFLAPEFAILLNKQASLLDTHPLSPPHSYQLQPLPYPILHIHLLHFLKPIHPQNTANINPSNLSTNRKPLCKNKTISRSQWHLHLPIWAIGYTITPTTFSPISVTQQFHQSPKITSANK